MCVRYSPRFSHLNGRFEMKMKMKMFYMDFTFCKHLVGDVRLLRGEKERQSQRMSLPLVNGSFD